MIYADGVVLGADTRSTNGETVADKNCEKINHIAPNIYCCGAGTAADTEAVTGTYYVYFSIFQLILILKGMVSSALFLHRKSTLRESRVVSSIKYLEKSSFQISRPCRRCISPWWLRYSRPSTFHSLSSRFL